MAKSAVSREGACRPHVVYLDHVARLSGAEIALSRLLPSLHAGVDASVILAEDGPLVERLRAAGVRVEVLPMQASLRDVRRGSVRAGGLGPGTAIAFLAYVFRLRKRIRQLSPNLVHTNSLKACIYGGLAGRLCGVPVVWHVRDRIAPDYLPRSAVRLVRLLSIILPSAVITNSQATLQTLPRRATVKAAYNPVVPDSVALQTTTGRGPKPRGEFVVGVVGRLAEWKGQHVFLAAFGSAFGGTSARARLIGSAMFGEEDYELRLRELSQELGIESQVEFRGFREDVNAELAELDILVHCSVSPEPFGQVVIEGMAAGLPVIAAAGGGPSEVVRDGVDGLLTPPGDVAALAAALGRLAADPALRSELGASAATAALRFRPEITARAVLDVYNSLLPRSSSVARGPSSPAN